MKKEPVDAIKAMESMMTPESIERSDEIFWKEMAKLSGRVIKFRAWDIKRSRYGEVMILDFLGKQGVRQTVYLHGVGTDDWWECNLADCVLEQFTGLLDVNGVETYHNDRVEDQNGKVGTIIWVDQKGSWVVDFGDEVEAIEDIGEWGMVIGNIHDTHTTEAGR